MKFNFLIDPWSTDNSQDDMFYTQVRTNKLKKKKKKLSSSAPLPAREIEYPCLVVFKRGGNIEFPFELLELVEDDSQGVDKKWISGIMNSESRKRSRDLKCYPDFMVSIFCKIQQGVSEKNRDLFIKNLNARFRGDLNGSKASEKIYENIVSEKPYRIVASTPLSFVQVILKLLFSEKGNLLSCYLFNVIISFR